jgi:nucleoside-diphosphate-sugar epimerase
MVGSALVMQLVQSGVQVIAYSRKPQSSRLNMLGVEWREMSTLSEEKAIDLIQDWIWLAPIKVLPEYLDRMRLAGGNHVVAVSTTSRFTKKESSSIAEKQFVTEIIAAEERLQAWAYANSTDWTILRPTMIYGMGMDKNINTIAKFIRRFHFFPTLGKAKGLRQPVHARDVATACEAALVRRQSLNKTYNISGAEVLSYREMVGRIFKSLSIRPFLIPIPLWLFELGVGALRVFPRFKSWSTAMAERMNQDMIFDHDAASRDLEYKPQSFRLDKEDLPPR